MTIDERAWAGELAEATVVLATELLVAANAQQTDTERKQAQRLARMMEDPNGKELTIAMVDQAFRSHRPARVANQLSYLLDRYGTPGYMDWWERVALLLGDVMGHYLPGMVIPPIVARLRQETRTVILPAEEEEMRRHLRKRREGGVRLNLNLLGEAILGEDEAQRRLNAYLALLARDDVEYISVKISSICSQINLVAFEHTVELIAARLQILYRQALAHHYHHPDGRVTPKFINLDMEEYRDLHLTVEAFRTVLDEPEFLSLRAGLALQAYLPDCFKIQQELTRWAIARCARGGSPIKVRIVKGANLAMEQVEASLRGWPQAPYTTKQEVDANFKRMVLYGCQPEHTSAVHLGIGSHNLFDIAFSLVVREREGVEDKVEFEMLEGMANHQARAVQTRAGGVLLYAPVVSRDDFHSAMAYLIRRLDENTAPENFLRDLFGLTPDSDAWRRQQDQFLAAYRLRADVNDQPRRTQDRRAEELQVLSMHADQDRPFTNEPDTDWTLAANRTWLQNVLAQWQTRESESITKWAQSPIPLQIAGEFIYTKTMVDGIDPSHTAARDTTAPYHHALADEHQIDLALDGAVTAHPEWAATPTAERKQLLLEAANALARRRGDLIGAMMLDGAKCAGEADPEISEAIDFARYYAHALDLGPALAGCRITSLGTVVVAPPWNFPVAIPTGGVLAALMAGNTVILKPAPETVLIAWHLVQALWEAGIPQKVLQFVPTTDNEVGRKLIVDPRVSAVILTGSIDTARLFLEWRPDLPLFAETSGKNALIITALADRDLAVKDLVRSAFGHSGQKCSAASLAICEAEVYDDPAFRRQLYDAAASLPVGPPWDPTSIVTPLTQPPSPKLQRALTSLDAGEEWLLEPRPVGKRLPGEKTPRLWTPGIKLGVQPGSFFHRTECFGPVLGLMRAENLEEAIHFANDVAFGLTGGIHSLDDREIEQYKERAQVGNLYVNRHITGSIVRRQPFGGWKASSVGSGAKAGGPNYVLQFGTWREETLPSQLAVPAPEIAELLEKCLQQVDDEQDKARLRASAASYAWAWQTYFGREHDPSQLQGESNIFRYRPCRHILLRAQDDKDVVAIGQVALAAATCDTPLTVSLPPTSRDWTWLSQSDGVQVLIEAEQTLLERLTRVNEYERLRTFTPVSIQMRQAANQALIHIVDAPVLANGRLELRHYLREQAISQTVHRYGNLMRMYEPGTGTSEEK